MCAMAGHPWQLRAIIGASVVGFPMLLAAPFVLHSQRLSSVGCLIWGCSMVLELVYLVLCEEPCKTLLFHLGVRILYLAQAIFLTTAAFSLPPWDLFIHYLVRSPGVILIAALY